MKQNSGRLCICLATVIKGAKNSLNVSRQSRVPITNFTDDNGLKMRKSHA